MSISGSLRTGTSLRGRLALSSLVGATGSALVALSTDVPRSPYGPNAAGLWPLAGNRVAPGWEGPTVPWWASVANSGPGAGDNHLVPALAAVTGVLLLGLAWVVLLRALRAGGPVSIRRLWLPVLAWTAPLFLAAPFASQDVWLYGAQGKAALLGFAAKAPNVVGHSVWLAGVDPKWAARPSGYGPGALGLSALFVELAHGRPWVAAECWRMAVVLSLIVCAWSVAKSAAARGHRPDVAVVAGVANPGILVVLVASIHNDVLMLALVAAGIALTVDGRPWWGIALCALAVTVKAPAALALLAIAWWAWHDSWRLRIARFATGGALAVLLLFLMGVPIGGGFGWVRATSISLSVSAFSLSGGLVGVRSNGAADVVQVFGILLAVALVMSVRDRIHWIGRLAFGFGALAFLSVTPQPWYLPWVAVVLVFEGVHRHRQIVGIGVLAVVMAWSELPLGTLAWFVGLVELVWIGFSSEREWRRERSPALTG